MFTGLLSTLIEQLYWKICYTTKNLFQVKLVRGTGTVVAPNKVEVKGEKGTEIVNTKNILLATGSEVTPFPGVTVS